MNHDIQARITSYQQSLFQGHNSETYNEGEMRNIEELLALALQQQKIETIKGHINHAKLQQKWSLYIKLCLANIGF